MRCVCAFRFSGICQGFIHYFKYQLTFKRKVRFKIKIRDFFIFDKIALKMFESEIVIHHVLSQRWYKIAMKNPYVYLYVYISIYIHAWIYLFIQIKQSFRNSVHFANSNEECTARVRREYMYTQQHFIQCTTATHYSVTL